MALATVMIVALLAASVALQRDDVPDAHPRILSVEVMNASAVMERVSKSAESVRLHIVEQGTVRLLARVEGLDMLDVFVSVNARTDFGHFSGQPLGGGLVAIDVQLPEVGSQWPSPGPGVGAPAQTVTIGADQVFVLQITGKSGGDASGEPLLVPGPATLVTRAQ